MPAAELPSLGVLIRRVRDQVQMPQPEFAKRVGTSLRTLVRWELSQGAPHHEHLHAMVRLVYPRNRELAAQLASWAGTSTDALVPEAQPTREHLVDSVVCAAAEAANLAPTPVRAVLAAGLARAVAVGLGIPDLLQALAPPNAGGKARAPKA